MKRILFCGVLFSVFCIFAQNNNSEKTNSNDQLLNQYVKSKGNAIIVFDFSNIKQFWIDNSVVSKNDSFEILLNKPNTKSFESIPLKIQLANVNETMDCLIEVITDTDDFSFSVLNNSSKVVSTSSPKEDFLNYKVASAVLHLENTIGSLFSLKFESKILSSLSMKRVILSFLDNKNSSFLVSPGTLKLANDNIESSSAQSTEVSESSFSVTGKRTIVSSSKKIFTTDNTLSSSVTIKNTGENATTVYIGYGAYSTDYSWINGRSFPYKPSNKTLSIVSAQEGDSRIIVDSYTDWAKGCHLALNASEDLSDIPNNTFAGTISNIKSLDDGKAEITLDRPLKTKIKEGTKVRVHGKSGAYLYTNIKVLQPGEEQTFTSTLKKDDSLLEFSSKAISRGSYYVVPIILSYSSDPNKENTILVSDYIISF